MNPTVVSLIALAPKRIGGNEYWCREFSAQLGAAGWRNVLCFLEPPAERVRQFLELPNVSFEVVEDSATTNSRAARGLWRVLRRHRPEILHLHYTGFIGAFPWLAKLAGVRRVFFTDHSSRPEGYVARPAALWKRLATRVINWPMERIFCVSDYGLRCWREAGVLPRNRFLRIYNSVDLPRVDASTRDGAPFRRKYAIPEDRAVVVQVSWLIPQKGIQDLLEAARIVVTQDSKAHFVFVGEGSHQKEFEGRALQLGIGNHVTWTGLVENPLAEGVFAAADVVCQMSRWEEVFGWTISEAMAFSRPLIATRVGAIPELVQDGANGFLVERGDTQAMADRILRLMGDPGLRERMGSAGRKLTEEKFDLKTNVAELIRLYTL